MILKKNEKKKNEKKKLSKIFLIPEDCLFWGFHHIHPHFLLVTEQHNPVINKKTKHMTSYQINPSESSDWSSHFSFINIFRTNKLL